MAPNTSCVSKTSGIETKSGDSVEVSSPASIASPSTSSDASTPRDDCASGPGTPSTRATSLGTRYSTDSGYTATSSDMIYDALYGDGGLDDDGEIVDLLRDFDAEEVDDSGHKDKTTVGDKVATIPSFKAPPEDDSDDGDGIGQLITVHS